MKPLYLSTALIVFWNLLAIPLQAEESLLTSGNLIPQSVVIQPDIYLGKEAIHLRVATDHKPAQLGGCDNCTFAWLPNTSFTEGVIEIEVAGKPVPDAPPWAKSFVGLVFHVNDNASSYQGFYLRPVNAVAEDPVFRQRSVQYFAYPDYPWSRLREESPGKYETWTDIQPGEWTKMKVAVKGNTAELYINGSNEPSLIVDELKLGAEISGAIGIYTEPATDAWFRELRIQQN